MKILMKQKERDIQRKLHILKHAEENDQTAPIERREAMAKTSEAGNFRSTRIFILSSGIAWAISPAGS